MTEELKIEISNLQDEFEEMKMIAKKNELLYTAD